MKWKFDIKCDNTGKTVFFKNKSKQKLPIKPTLPTAAKQ